MPSNNNTKASTLPSLLHTTIANGRFLLTKELGQGSFARVYLAEETSTRDKYAVKCMTRYEYYSEEDVEQRKEFTYHRHASEHSSRVAHLYEVIYEHKFVFAVLDFYEGGTLFDAISDGKVFHNNPFMIKTTWFDLADAVSEVHGAGIYHRDLKPENVLVSEDCYHTFVADFGLATKEAISEVFQVGTPCYMSPECLNLDLTHDIWSPETGDVWALFLVLFNMATGRRPFEFADESDACYAAFSEDSDYLQKAFGLTDEFNELCIRVLHPDFRDIRTVAELKEEVAPIQDFAEAAPEPIVTAFDSMSTLSEVELSTPLTFAIDVAVVDDDVEPMTLSPQPAKHKRRALLPRIPKRLPAFVKACRRIIHL
ncbi:kinase-like domain-containing protein [Flagelloscypha sp. PMI_526]|nr:kinase-like domain-containing protein [Flagelloscypha sp. PMI_526]